MFADVAGSTAMYENMGDDLARERISKALNALILIIQRFNGVLVKTIGDEILVYFVDIDKALFAAKAIQEAMEDDRSPETVGVSIRIGMQYGSAILESDDIYGDTVNVASRVANIAKARQVLCTQEIAFLVKDTELSDCMRAYDRIQVKGRTEHIHVYLYAWEGEADITNMANASSFTNPARHTQVQNLNITYGKHSYSLPATTTSYILGRGKDCELVVQGDLISRYHTKIENRRGKFILTDQSTNGTFVQTTEGQDFFLRREELTLFGSGYISLGKKVDMRDFNIIQFSCD